MAAKTTKSPLSKDSLPTHETFEELYQTTKDSLLVYFTANWCGACKRVDWGFIREEFPDLPIYRCDVDENKYTPGFCGVRSIPAFVMVHPPKEGFTNKQITAQFQSSETAKIASWIMTNLITPK